MHSTRLQDNIIDVYKVPYCFLKEGKHPGNLNSYRSHAVLQTGRRRDQESLKSGLGSHFVGLGRHTVTRVISRTGSRIWVLVVSLGSGVTSLKKSYAHHPSNRILSLERKLRQARRYPVQDWDRRLSSHRGLRVCSRRRSVRETCQPAEAGSTLPHTHPDRVDPRIPGSPRVAPLELI